MTLSTKLSTVLSTGLSTALSGGDAPPSAPVETFGNLQTEDGIDTIDDESDQPLSTEQES